MYLMLMPLRRFAIFTGRAQRMEYWLWLLFILAVLALLTWLDIKLGLGGSATGSTTNTGASFNVNLGPTGAIFMIATFIPSLAVSVRRLHDLDKSGWMMLIALIPFFGGLWLLFMFTQPGTIGANRFGEDPKGHDETGIFG